MSQLNKRERSLVALGAALASNCVPCVEFHVPAARKVGLTDGEINEALQIADKVRQVPARAVLESAMARLESLSDDKVETGAADCGCGG